MEISTFFTENRHATIKGRVRDNGFTQRSYTQETASSPTIETNSVLITRVANADKVRYVMILDIPSILEQTNFFKVKIKLSRKLGIRL